MMWLEIIFWLCFIAIVMHYVLFGLLVQIMAKVVGQKHAIDNSFPSISFIVAAYNEEKVIGDKIRNDLAADYPKEKLEYIVVSDGSTDRTASIAREFGSQGVISLHEDKRAGKTAALNRAVALAKNEILVFSDANSMFRRDALEKLVRHFADESIGGVCGRKSVLTDENRKASLGDSLYWSYESSLKQAESHLGSIPTADGEIFAMRRSLYQEVPAQLINDDLVITFNIVTSGKRVIYDQEAITEEQASHSFADDFNVKSRMVYGGIQIIEIYKKLLNPLTSWFGLQFFFHKTLRYFMWSLLVGIYVTNLPLARLGSFYSVFLGLQTLFYAMAIIGLGLDRMSFKMGVFYLPYYYCNVNLAAAKGFLFFLRQRSNVEVWKKAQR